MTLPSGCYVICDEAEADGVCVKVPKEMTDENGTITTCEDAVFSIKEGGLHGTEELCKIEPAQIGMNADGKSRTRGLKIGVLTVVSYCRTKWVWLNVGLLWTTLLKVHMSRSPLGPKSAKLSQRL